MSYVMRWFGSAAKSSESREGGTRSEAEEKAYTWIYTLAQADKDLVYEYVRSTERGILSTITLHGLN